MVVTKKELQNYINEQVDIKMRNALYENLSSREKAIYHKQLNEGIDIPALKSALKKGAITLGTIVLLAMSPKVSATEKAQLNDLAKSNPQVEQTSKIQINDEAEFSFDERHPIVGIGKTQQEAYNNALKVALQNELKRKYDLSKGEYHLDKQINDFRYKEYGKDGYLCLMEVSGKIIKKQEGKTYSEDYEIINKSSFTHDREHDNYIMVFADDEKQAIAQAKELIKAKFADEWKTDIKNIKLDKNSTFLPISEYEVNNPNINATHRYTIVAKGIVGELKLKNM